jgi:hypothetical protein
MTASTAQKSFNPFVDFNKRTRRDIWHGLTKSEKQQNLKAVVYCFLIDGGQITKIPPKTTKGKGRHQSFAAKSVGKTSSSEYWRYFTGDNIAGEHRWTSKPVKTSTPPRTADGVVIKIGDKIKSRDEQQPDVASEVDLLSERAISESTARDKQQGIKINYAAKPEQRGKDELDHIAATIERDDRAWAERRERQIRVPEHPKHDSGTGNGPLKLAA